MPGVVERGVVQRGDVPQPHEADVGDHAERRDARTARPPARRRWIRRVAGPEEPLRQRQRESDRRQVGDQQVLDHVERRELLAEPVERRDERDEQRPDPGRPQRRTALPGRPSAALGPRPAPAEAIDDRVRDQRADDERRERPGDVDVHAADRRERAALGDAAVVICGRLATTGRHCAGVRRTDGRSRVLTSRRVQTRR